MPSGVGPSSAKGLTGAAIRRLAFKGGPVETLEESADPNDGGAIAVDDVNFYWETRQGLMYRRK
jgi:hypothetical protein